MSRPQCSALRLRTLLLCSFLAACRASWLHERPLSGHPRFGEAQVPPSAAVRYAREQLAEMMGLTVEEADELQRRADRTHGKHLDPADTLPAAGTEQQGGHAETPQGNDENVLEEESKPDKPATTLGADTLRRVFHTMPGSDGVQTDELTFDMSDWSADGRAGLTIAILRLAPWHAVGFMTEGNPHDHPVVRISVSSAGEEAKGGGQSDEVARLFFLHGSDWCRLNVTQFLLHMPALSKQLSLKITVSPGPTVTDLDGILSSFKPSFSPPSGDQVEEPRLTVVSREPSKRVLGKPDHRVKRESDPSLGTLDDPNSNRDIIDVQEGRQCRRSALSAERERAGICNSYCYKFDVDAMGWGQFIVSPLLFEIGRCGGNCGQHEALPESVAARHFLDEQGDSILEQIHKVNITAHAKAQHRLTRTLPRLGLPSTSCVPISYTRLTIIYQDYSGGTVVKLISDAIVKQCGCA